MNQRPLIVILLLASLLQFCAADQEIGHIQIRKRSLRSDNQIQCEKPGKYALHSQKLHNSSFEYLVNSRSTNAKAIKTLPIDRTNYASAGFIACQKWGKPSQKIQLQKAKSIISTKTRLNCCYINGVMYCCSGVCSANCHPASKLLRK